ncbi:MAG: hypothetical protein WCO92_04040 [Verrucomicrobiota bacterium]
MSAAEYEAALQKARESLHSVVAPQGNIDSTFEMEEHVGRFVAGINSVAKRPVDKRKIATQLKADAQAELSAVGQSSEDKQLDHLGLANKRREKQYRVQIATAALKEFQA